MKLFFFGFSKENNKKCTIKLQAIRNSKMRYDRHQSNFNLISKCLETREKLKKKVERFVWEKLIHLFKQINSKIVDDKFC